jgi:predicted membrane-bound dolichyl-phosphate-mannose-protein mannosyltransferase
MLVIEVTSVRGESQTWDEAIYLAAGYSYWHGSDHRLNREHPLLGKLLVALPLLPYNLTLSKNDVSWAQNDETRFGRLFLYQNRLPADKMLFLGRSATIVLSLLLGVLIALWTRTRAGPWAGIIAVALYAFDPTVLAHGRYATNDLAVTFFAFAAVCLWDWSLNGRSPGRYAAAGSLLALAIAGRRRIRCVTAVSVTYLYGKSFVGHDAGRWLREMTPTAKVGYSIYVYDLRLGDPTADTSAP